MFDVWESFGVKSLSPSQLSKWSQDRGLWYASARQKIREDAGPAAWRGDAVEAGLHAALLGKPSPGEVAARTFELRSNEWSNAHDGEVHEKHDEEEAKVQPCLARAVEAWSASNLPAPVAYQVTAEGFLPGTRVKSFGKPDFALHSYEGPFCVDLKSTSQMPSEAKPEHALAASIYATLRSEKRADLLYVSTAQNPKATYRLITLDEDEIAYYARAAVQLVRQIETTLLAAVAMSEFELVSPEQALAELCRPNLLARGGGFFDVWKDEHAAASLAAIPAWQ